MAATITATTDSKHENTTTTLTSVNGHSATDPSVASSVSSMSSPTLAISSLSQSSTSLYDMIWTRVWMVHDCNHEPSSSSSPSTPSCYDLWMIWMARSSCECSSTEFMSLKHWSTNEARVHGIPHTLRARIWPLVAKSDDYVRKNDGVYASLRYSSLLTPSTTASSLTAGWTKKIARDLDRTYTDTPFFTTKGRHTVTNREILSHILHAYACMDSSVGYCQGMNYVAAAIMMTLHPVDTAAGALFGDIRWQQNAFWLFYIVLKDSRSMFCPGVPGFIHSTQTFGALLPHVLPKLHAHFTKHGVRVDMFAQCWFLGLFCYPLIPLSLTQRIWDAYLVDGFGVFHRAGLAALQLRETELLSLDSEETLLPALMAPLRVDAQTLMQRANTIIINNQQLVAAMNTCDPASMLPS